MTTDDFFIKNDSSCANALVTSAPNEVIDNENYISKFSSYQEFPDAITRYHKYRNYIELRAKYDKEKISIDKIREIEEKILYICNAYTTAYSPILFRLDKRAKNAPHMTSRTISEINNETFNEYESFTFTVFLDFKKSIFNIIDCFIQMYHIMNDIRKMNYDALTCRIGKYNIEEKRYLYLAINQPKYEFDWNVLQYEVYDTSGIKNPVNKANHLALLLTTLNFFSKDELRYVSRRIYDCFSKYNKRKLLKG